VETPSSFQPHSAYSLALDEAGRLGEAIEQARLAVDANPVFFKSRLNYAIILDRAGRRDDALAQFSAAARLNQKVPDPWLGEARVWLEAGTYGEARTAAGRALEIDPANSIAHEYLGVISAQSGNWSDAVAQYRESARLDLSAINPRHELTDLLGRLGRWSEAVPVYQEIVRLAPESADAHNDCGVALLNSGHAAQARDEFTAALKIEPYHQAARENLLHAGSGQ
jgi:Flp pilus assembly protein TadD